MINLNMIRKKIKNNFPKIFIFLALLSVVAFFSRGVLHDWLDVTNRDNEVEHSLTKVPSDVTNAVDAARLSHLPVKGIRADGPSYKVPVLMYHYVENVKDKGDKIRMSLNIPPSVFEQQLKTLIDAGYTFLTPSDIADVLDGIKNLPDKPVVLTFDDGYKDFYTDAFPILRKYNVKSSEYIVSGFLGRPNYMTETELKEISKSRLVEIGAHTVHHLALTGLPENAVKNEIEQSKIQIESIIGESVTTFAYPYGFFDINTVQIAKKEGFRTALSTIPGSEIGNYNRFYVNRIRPGWTMGEKLLRLISEK